MRNPEIWIILIIVGFLLFGAKKMPDAARGLGRSLRIFKAETKGLASDDEHPQYQQQPAQQQQIPPAQPYQQQPYQQQPYQQQPAPAVGQTAPADASAERPQAQ
jgi:sec-independent protein translocase protein TatA